MSSDLSGILGQCPVFGPGSPGFGGGAFGPNDWSPLGLENVTFVFNPDAGISLATGVAQWTPQVGPFSLGQASGGLQPAFGAVAGLNGRNALTFDGSDDILANATTYDWALGFYIAAVCYPTTLAGLTRTLVGTNTASGAGTILAALGASGIASLSLFDSGGVNRFAVSANSVAINNPALVELRYYGSTLGARLNNGTEGTTVVASPPSTARGISIGSDGSTRDFAGSIALVVICRGVSADPANRAQLLQYVRNNYIPGLP